jgi:hypothetical protein
MALRLHSVLLPQLQVCQALWCLGFVGCLCVADKACMRATMALRLHSVLLACGSSFLCVLCCIAKRRICVGGSSRHTVLAAVLQWCCGPHAVISLSFVCALVAMQEAGAIPVLVNGSVGDMLVGCVGHMLNGFVCFACLQEAGAIPALMAIEMPMVR